MINTNLLLAYAIKTHSWSTRQQQHQLGQTTVQLRKRTGFDDVGHRLGLTTGAHISVCKTFNRLHNALDRCGNGSGETTVVVEG